MTTFIEDSPRSFQAGWITRAHQTGTASGAVMTPWATPYVHRGGPGLKPGVGPRVQELRDAGVSVWFDATTHALQMPGVGDFRYYAEYNLWGGPVGDLTQDAYRREHVRRVFKHQTELGTPLVAPAPLLPSGLNNVSTLALETARVALELQPTAGLTIAGVGTFWSDRRDLDAHVGALAALMPAGWFVSFVQPDNDLPPKLTAEEVYGICRTVRALSEYVPVHVSHGDFAALPAVAAGATTVGTGWDKRQRVVSYTDYAPRPETTGQASWYERPSFVGLLGTLDRKADGPLLQQQDGALTARLGGLAPVPNAEGAFQHHVAQLDAAVRRIQGVGYSYRQRYDELDRMYTEASTNWAAVQAATGLRDRSNLWVNAYQQGLRMYGHSEGWIL
ncbi:hypothetical protein JNB63_11840 [Microbacterium trichothecenolyticum]|uniref:hypothetical protein n=1 Tax=Microbacterium trichothecenolyticum TaxID=69370 RepID=UPI001C6E4327|nr:hypothetical protein [Microbacterium trichothecenolyticum]MBW9120786.1 hypothetical protein [Microbacterium trichothecenolyticum]